MKFPWLLGVFMSLVLINGCSYPTEWQTVNVQNKFTVEVPPFFKPDKELSENAQMQYCNRFRNFYSIGIIDNKTDDFQAYNQKVVKPLLDYVQDGTITDSLNLEIDGKQAIWNSVVGNMKIEAVDEYIYYDHVSIKGDKHFYQICTWTRGPKRRDLYKADMERILKSFKEL